MAELTPEELMKKLGKRESLEGVDLTHIDLSNFSFGRGIFDKDLSGSNLSIEAQMKIKQLKRVLRWRHY